MPESEYAARLAAGDPATIRDLYQAYGNLVYSVPYRVVGDGELAADATQETFLQAWRAAGRYRPPRPVGAWLTIKARTVAIDLRRREPRAGADDGDVPDRAPGTSLPTMKHTNNVWQLRHALQDLPDEDRLLIRMQHYDDLTHAEIARQLGIAPGAAQSRSRQAHRRLVELLGHPRVSQLVRHPRPAMRSTRERRATGGHRLMECLRTGR